MLPIRFDASGWRLSLALAHLDGARLLLSLADGRELDLLAEADEPQVTELGEGATVTRVCAAHDALLARMVWTCEPQAVTLQVHIKALQPLGLQRLTLLDAPLADVKIADSAIARRVVTQPASMGFRQSPGAYSLTEGPESCTMVVALGNSSGALALGQVGEPRRTISLATSDARLRVWCDLEGQRLAPGDTLQSERLYITADASLHAALERYGDQYAPLGRYVSADVCGWNSWDYYLRSINQEMVEENVACLDARPWLRDAARAVVIDDGWQNSRGDWRPGSHFDLPAFVARCRAAGRLPGIWLAPFCVDTNSPLVRQRPDLLVYGADGVPQLGLMWFMLDPTHDESERMIRRWFRDLYAIGFRYFKVDFILVLMMAERLAHETTPRLETVRRVLRAIREEIGESYFLGCSAPPEAVVGICDGNRIGADIRPDWGAILHATRTVAAKYWMHNRLYVSDADFVVVRSPETSDDPHRVHPMTLSRQAMRAGMGIPGGPPDLGGPRRPAGAPSSPQTPAEGDPFMEMMGRRPAPLTQLGESRCWVTVSLLSGGPLTLSDRLSQLNAAGWRQIETMFRLFTGVAARPLDLLDAETPAVWVRDDELPLLALFNWSDAPVEITVGLQSLPASLRGPLVDAWSGESYVPEGDRFRLSVAARDVALLRREGDGAGVAP